LRERQVLAKNVIIALEKNNYTGEIIAIGKSNNQLIPGYITLSHLISKDADVV